MTGYAEIRRFALSLPEVTEEPHVDMTSFRVRGKIFATVPPGEDRLHVFVGPLEIGACVAEDPAAFAPLRWGQQVRGLCVTLTAAGGQRVAELLVESWRRKAPKSLAALLEQHGPALGGGRQ